MSTPEFYSPPCDKCSAPVDLTHPQTLVVYRDGETITLCGPCHLPAAVLKAQAALNDFVADTI